MDDIESLLTDQIRSGLCTGAQVARIVDEQESLWSMGVDGIGLPITDETISAVYCASKLLLAFAAHGLITQGRLSLSTTLGEAFSAPRVGAPAVNVGQLLNHTAGVHSADGERLKLCSHARKIGISLAAIPPTGWRADRDAAYSEYVGWALLAAVAESATGQSWDTLVEDLVLDPVDGHEAVVPRFEPARFAASLDRIRINVDLRDGATPLLHERGSTFACESNPGYGAYASASGLARVLHRHLSNPSRRFGSEGEVIGG